jgi:trimeric autotransporter adhesin
MISTTKRWLIVFLIGSMTLAGCGGSGTGSGGGSAPPTGATNPPGGAPTPTPLPTNPATTTAAGFPQGFWDASDIPPAKNVMMFKFLNRTNGKYPDSQVFWSTNINGVTTTNSIAEQPTFDMPANSSGRIYFYLGNAGTSSTDYYDFIEYTISPTEFNGNTTRVDAFGIKLAMYLHCADGYEAQVGENAATFAEDRSVTFQRFMNAVPAPFQALGTIDAPYRIPSPGGSTGFDAGGANQDYYNSYAAQIWTNNALTIPTPGPNGSGLANYPDLSAAIMRHVGAAAGTFTPTGQLANQALWNDSTTFYQAAPADYYAQFWHANAINGKAYGFPYDDVGGYSSFVAHNNPQYILIAIGW